MTPIPTKKLLKGVSVFPRINFSGGGTNDYHNDPTEADGQGTYNIYKGSFIIGYGVYTGNSPGEMGTYLQESAEIFSWGRSSPSINPREFFTLNLQAVQTSYREGYESENRFCDLSISQPYDATVSSVISYNSILSYPDSGQGGDIPMPIKWDACVVFDVTDKSLRFKIVKQTTTLVLSQIIKGIYTIY